ncbi:MAG: alanine racemase [Christensenellales bacterium]
MDFFNNLVLNSENLKHNLKIIKKKACGKKVCAMVKANAYGHNLKFVVLNLKNDVDFFGVANAQEALEVRNFAQKIKILVCGKVQSEDVLSLLENNISLTVFSIKSLLEVVGVCKKNGIKANVHVKLNTGMNRLGIKSKSNLLKMIGLIDKNKNWINLEGVYSHLFNADNVGLAHTQYNRFLELLNCFNEYNQIWLNQNKSIKKFSKRKNKRKYRLLYNYSSKNCEKYHSHKKFDLNKILIHLENSAGLFNNADYLNVCNMARVGIALYGLEIKNQGLKPVLSLSSKIVQIQKVKEEDYVGYGKTVVEKNAKIAVVPIGYADGIVRAYKNHFVMVLGKLCKIVNVCMDSILIDVSQIVAKVGDKVDIVTTNVTKPTCANNIAKHLETIAYEVVTNLHHTRLNIVCE